MTVALLLLTKALFAIGVGFFALGCLIISYIMCIKRDEVDALAYDGYPEFHRVHPEQRQHLELARLT